MCLRKMTILFGARLSLRSPSSPQLTNRLAWLRLPRVGIEACATVLCDTELCATELCATELCATELCATVLCATELCATVLCLGILTQHFCRECFSDATEDKCRCNLASHCSGYNFYSQ